MFASSAAFDTSAAVRLRSPLSTMSAGTCPGFPQCSPPLLLTTAACGGLKPAPDCRPRRAFLHLLYSCAPSYRRHYPTRTSSATVNVAAQRRTVSYVEIKVDSSWRVQARHACPGRLVAIASHPAGGDGEHRDLLEERVFASRGGRNSHPGRQCLPCQERAGSQDRCRRLGMAGPVGALRASAGAASFRQRIFANSVSYQGTVKN